MSALPWLAKCTLMAAVVLLACRLATVWIGPTMQQPVATARDGTLITFNRYIHEAMPDVVLVGSSIAWRLKEEYFSTARVRNLAVAGGSPVTGLAIVANQPRLPKIVVIETNVLTRPIDGALVQKFSGRDRPDPVFVRPVRTAIAAYEMWNHPPPDPAHLRASQEQLLRQPPSEFDNRVYVDRAVQQMNTVDPTTPTRANVAEISKLIADIEQRGSRALLLEVPLQSETEKTQMATISREIVAAAFPDKARWLYIEPVRSELRWADGVHLDERSALMVARSIEQALTARGEK